MSMTISVSSLSDTTQMNNAVPTSPLLQQMGHPHSYPSLGQISNPYEQQPPGKELNKYASLKAVGKHLCVDPCFFLLPPFCVWVLLLSLFLFSFFYPFPSLSFCILFFSVSFPVYFSSRFHYRGPRLLRSRIL